MSHPSIPVSDSNLATGAASPRGGIVARLVPDHERMGFLPRHFGSRRFLQGENAVYDWMRRLCPDYTGGFWEFVELSNGGFYMRPSKDSTYMHLCVDGNGFDRPVSADAAGIIVTLFALNSLLWAGAQDLAKADDALREFAFAHAEGRSILRAID